MFARAPAAPTPRAAAAGRARCSVAKPVNPAWQGLALSVRSRPSAADGSGPDGVLRRFPSLAGSALPIRRAIPVNVPHPGNRPAEATEEDERLAGAGTRGGPVRRAPKVGRSDDPAETQADQVADRILRMPRSPDPGESPLRPLTLPAAGGGRPLAADTRAFFEPRLGVDLGRVRLHEGPEEATAAAQIDARAFTHGSDIWLGAGEHEGDRRLLAHELAHVVQAGAGEAAPDGVRRYVRVNTLYLWDVYDTRGRDATLVTDADLRTTIEYEDYRRADLVWRFSDTVALAALRRSMDLFAAGVRGRGPNYIRSAREARAAAHGLERIELTELGFTGDHMIASVSGWGAAPGPNIDDPDGSAPVWTNAGTADPVAYTKGTAPSMFARFLVAPAIAPAVPGVMLRAKVDGTIVGLASGLTLNGSAIESAPGGGRVTGIGAGAPIPGSAHAGQIDRVVQFEVSTDAGRIWFQAGSAPIQFFFTEATPMPPGGRLRQDALDLATLAALSPPIPSRMAEFVQALVFYDPSVRMPASFATTDAVMETLAIPHQCDSQAYLMRYLLMSLGIAADVDYFWRGSPGGILVYRYGSWYGPSYRYDRPAEQLAEAQPHFLFHALTVVGGARYDPTYGQSSVGAILESAPGATDQFAPRATFLATPVTGSGWTCPH